MLRGSVPHVFVIAGDMLPQRSRLSLENPKVPGMSRR
jgi:hypothetical protein